MTIELAKARDFVKSIDLDGVPIGMTPVHMGAGADAGEVFAQGKSQAQVVGSSLFSFAKGVDADVRDAISDSALLAQLVANKRASVTTAPIEWFKVYSEVLQNVGWTLQDSGWTEYTAADINAEVHEQIVKVLSAALGPAPAALAIVLSALDALKAMNSDSPWITLFNRESQQAKIARFQVGLVETGQDADVYVSLVACLIEANSSITQVLFFKFRKANASFKANTNKVSINGAALRDLGPEIRKKVRDYQTDYVSSIVDI